MQMDLVLFGIQGSGKGTQAKRLAEEFGYYVFEAGAELRKMKASGTELGDTVQQYIDQGELVPFEIIMKVVKEAILAQPKDQQIIFDGIPRDKEQMESFNAIMEEGGREFRCIEITLDPEVAFARILGRAKQEGRTDDSDESKIRRRMALFSEKTAPVITYYNDMHTMERIDGSGTMDDVYARLTSALS